MLVPTMNDQELTRAVWMDLAVLEKSSTIPRLKEEYDRERRKKRIPTDAAYPRHYPVRTKAKNNWIIFLQKAPSEPRYRGWHDIAGQSIVYYFGPRGIMAFKPIAEQVRLFVFQAHLFTRYCQRLALELTEPLDKVVHFFTHNGVAEHLLTESNGKILSIGVCRDGVLLGETRAEVNWIFNRTFVNRAVFHRYQHLAEAKVVEALGSILGRAEKGLLPAKEVERVMDATQAIFSCTPAELGDSPAHGITGG